MKRWLQLVCAVCLVATGAAAQTTAPPSSISHEALLKYVGAYKLPGGDFAVITLEETQLFVTDPAGAPIELFPKSEATFSLEGTEVEVQFSKDASGVVTGLVLKTPDGAQTFTKVIVAREILAKYVGTYPLKFTGAVTVSLEANQLMWQLGDQDKYPMFPQSEKQFFSEDGASIIVFGEDPGGARYFTFQAPGIDNEKVMRK